MMKNKKLSHQSKLWLFADKITSASKTTFIPKIVFYFGLLLASQGINAHSMSKDLMISAFIIKHEHTDGLRIEAETFNFFSTYSSSLGAFNPIKIPFKVFSAQSYQLETDQFSFRCKSETELDWADQQNTLDIYFDEAPIPFEQTNRAGRLNLPDVDYLKPTFGGQNVSPNPYPNEGWDAWYREHQFDIVQTEFPQKEEAQRCLGQIAVIATSII